MPCIHPHLLPLMPKIRFIHCTLYGRRCPTDTPFVTNRKKAQSQLWFRQKRFFLFHGAWSGSGSMHTPGRTVSGNLKEGYSGQDAKLNSHHYLGYVEL